MSIGALFQPTLESREEEAIFERGSIPSSKERTRLHDSCDFGVKKGEIYITPNGNRGVLFLVIAVKEENRQGRAFEVGDYSTGLKNLGKLLLGENALDNPPVHPRMPGLPPSHLYDMLHVLKNDYSNTAFAETEHTRSKRVSSFRRRIASVTKMLDMSLNGLDVISPQALRRRKSNRGNGSELPKISVKKLVLALPDALQSLSALGSA